MPRISVSEAQQIGLPLPKRATKNNLEYDTESGKWYPASMASDNQSIADKFTDPVPAISSSASAAAALTPPEAIGQEPDQSAYNGDPISEEIAAEKSGYPLSSLPSPASGYTWDPNASGGADSQGGGGWVPQALSPTATSGWSNSPGGFNDPIGVGSNQYGMPTFSYSPDSVPTVPSSLLDPTLDPNYLNSIDAPIYPTQSGTIPPGWIPGPNPQGQSNGSGGSPVSTLPPGLGNYGFQAQVPTSAAANIPSLASMNSPSDMIGLAANSSPATAIANNNQSQDYSVNNPNIFPGGPPSTIANGGWGTGQLGSNTAGLSPVVGNTPIDQYTGSTYNASGAGSPYSDTSLSSFDQPAGMAQIANLPPEMQDYYGARGVQNFDPNNLYTNAIWGPPPTSVSPYGNLPIASLPYSGSGGGQSAYTPAQSYGPISYAPQDYGPIASAPYAGDPGTWGGGAPADPGAAWTGEGGTDWGGSGGGDLFS